MNLDDLSADELAALDAVCLEFEHRFGTDMPMSVDQAVQLYQQESSAASSTRNLSLLRQELTAIEAELRSRRDAQQSRPAAGKEPFQPKVSSAVVSRQPTSSPSKQTADNPGKLDLGSQRPAEGDSSAAYEPEETQFADPTNLDSPRRLPQSETAASTSKPTPPSTATDSAAEHSSARRPITVGPYTIDRILGRGGMGVVYRATDTRLDRPVAIKMLGFPNLSPDDPKRMELVDRFEREAKAVAALSHPNIVELFDVGVTEGVPYAVMEFLRGETLAERLSQAEFSVGQTTEIGMQIAGALATAHAAGVVHRDLKPQNIMLVVDANTDQSNEPRAKLVDFGLSRISDSVFGKEDQSSQTREGMILGTPGYMAPEQARGETADTAADIFAFGCVLYEVLYGKPAIGGDTPADRLAETLQGTIAHDQQRCQKSQLLCKLISDCLQKNPQERPSASEAYSKLRSVNSPLGRDSKPNGNDTCDSTTDPEDSWTRRHVITTCAGGLLGGLFGGYSLKSPEALGGVRSLAVLTFNDLENRSAAVETRPVASPRPMSDGEVLASAVANELSSVDGLMVMPYRPFASTGDHDVTVLNQDLNVDAFVTGDFSSQTYQQSKVWNVNWRLINATSGKVMTSGEFVSENAGPADGSQFLSQSVVASSIAKQIGHAIVTTGEAPIGEQPDASAYGCMMKGIAYADPDSTSGLEMAIRCFEKAASEDDTQSKPFGAIAVASLNLAARSQSTAESRGHLQKARENIAIALEKDEQSLDGQLAKAMLEWQQLQNYDLAYELLSRLATEHRYRWLVQHQFGLLLATLGKLDQATRVLDTAQKLNPYSLLVKTDRARVVWFDNNFSRAQRDAQRYYDETNPRDEARVLATGLLIDINEHVGDYTSAASLQGIADPGMDREAYFQERRSKLVEFPYGPFGALLNRTILDLRSGLNPDSETLSILNESAATMFPLLLSQHFALEDLRLLNEASLYLPPNHLRAGS